MTVPKNTPLLPSAPAGISDMTWSERSLTQRSLYNTILLYELQEQAKVTYEDKHKTGDYLRVEVGTDWEGAGGSLGGQEEGL